MNQHNKVTKEELKKVKVWTVLVENPNDCPRVYGFRSLNQAISKAYDIVREEKAQYESLEEEEKGFFEYYGNQSSPYKYSLTACKEIIKDSLVGEPKYHLSYSESYHDYQTFSIEIEGHGL